MLGARRTLLTPRPKVIALGGGAGVTATWDSTGTGSNSTNPSNFSNGNLTATCIISSSQLRGRATHSITDGEAYWEVTATNIAASNGHHGIGVMNEGFNLTGQYVGGDQKGVSMYNGDAIYKNGVNVGAFSHTTTGEVIGVHAVWHPGGTKTIQFFKSGSSSSVIDISSLTGTLLYPAYELETTADAVTVNFGATAFALSAASGKSSFNSVAG